MSARSLEFCTGADRPFYESALPDAAAEAAVWRRYFAQTRDLLLVNGGNEFAATQPLRTLCESPRASVGAQRTPLTRRRAARARAATPLSAWRASSVASRSSAWRN